MSGSRTVHVVVPDGIDDPTRPSGGNTYDRRLCRGLADAGWAVRTHAVAGDWPRPCRSGQSALAAALAPLPAGALVLVDGLVASAAHATLVSASRRLRLVVLLHMPLGVGAAGEAPAQAERAVLAAAVAVVATSDWTRRWLLAAYGLDPARVHVARPGVDPAPPAAPDAHGGRMLCVGPVVPAKGHDVLVAALSTLADLAWRCRCVGALDHDAAFVVRLREHVRTAGIGDRVILAGPATGLRLAAVYADADVLVHPSRAETYGMVVTEALSRGLPVVAADVGGVAEALGVAPRGRRPGLLVPVGDAAALGTALRRWLTDGQLRADLRRAAGWRRCALAGWEDTADRVARVLERAAA